MGKTDRQKAYQFLNKLTERYPEDAQDILKDIIVSYWLFPHGDGSDTLMSGLDQQVGVLLGAKINAIKLVKDTLNIGLKEAKDYVEDRVWPTVAGSKAEKMLEIQRITVAKILEKITKDYMLE